MNRFILFILLALYFSGCASDELVYEYEEIVIQSPVENFPASRAARETTDASLPAFSWQTPEDWQEEKGNGMRLATFTSAREGDNMECTIVSLPGDVGGLEANITRWLGQLGLTDVEDEALSQFAQSQNVPSMINGLPVRLLDFGYFQKEAPMETPSMKVAMIELSQSVVFIKMTGSKQEMAANTPPFEALITSFRLETRIK